MNCHHTTLKELYLCHYLYWSVQRGALNSRLVNICSVVFSAKFIDAWT